MSIKKCTALSTHSQVCALPSAARQIIAIPQRLRIHRCLDSSLPVSVEHRNLKYAVMTVQIRSCRQVALTTWTSQKTHESQPHGMAADIKPSARLVVPRTKPPSIYRKQPQPAVQFLIETSNRRAHGWCHSASTSRGTAGRPRLHAWPWVLGWESPQENSKALHRLHPGPGDRTCGAPVSHVCGISAFYWQANDPALACQLPSRSTVSNA